MNNYFNSETCVLCKLSDELDFLVKEVMLFRGVSEYINQLLPETDLNIVTNMFTIHSDMSLTLKNYFLTKFSPLVSHNEREERLLSLEAELDRFQHGELSTIIIALFKNIVRTNYFLDKESIAFKVELKNFKHLIKGLQPNYEIFVYHPEFMGTHLRMTHVSRGGLRWSERDDFREEIRSLMITQDGKNSIIVPAGAKGGFIIAKEKDCITKPMFADFYSKFIHNLLDLVDNRTEDGEAVHNPSVIAYDSGDTYFVVAADKGTAQMSDVANQIAIYRNFWLGDAFASGGSNGYSHKDLGITAKGSFVSTERFFIEKGVDFYKESISVVGIGSMNGDVFGNGILLSKKFKLVGAISHKEIFIDPDPDPETSYGERRRLFFSDNGSWSQYRKELISKGGGVFERKAGHIQISQEMKTLFSIEDDSLTGDELIQKMLTAKVDLLFNGGVGTYVKSSDETNDEVGDRGNSSVRVDAKNLRAFAVCEGGNLGFTQKARVEYSLKGGKINLDGIDNSAGVNISDHEVNLKILLKTLNISKDERRKMLKMATDEVVELVLQSNYNQALGLSLDEERAKNSLSEFSTVVDILEERLPQFKRDHFAISERENFQLSRPNIAFLFSYSKILTQKILVMDHSEDNLLSSYFASEFLLEYFPHIVQEYRNEILQHPLYREIIATVIADRVINAQGVTLIAGLKNRSDDDFRATISRYLRMEKLVEADKIRKKLSQSGEYQSLLNFESELGRFESELREFARGQ